MQKNKKAKKLRKKKEVETGAVALEPRVHERSSMHLRKSISRKKNNVKDGYGCVVCSRSKSQMFMPGKGIYYGLYGGPRREMSDSLWRTIFFALYVLYRNMNSFCNIHIVGSRPRVIFIPI